ncbi:MAG: hypothetical protein ISS28_03405 [Candidatus Cloacimonetes bacterium]|nr:hypothetical protein [Candidatus Cloacimonadota bacterium]MBL7086138.1 hypothetical protein [Candidatus Cloacimonadota bacterium]
MYYRKGHTKVLFLIFVILLLTNCATKYYVAPELPEEIQVERIPLTGPVSSCDSEISGLAWYNDYLILLPQYPSRFESDYDGKLFAISKETILSFLNGKTDLTITPIEVDFVAPGISYRINGYEGFEAIAFSGNKVFMTIESSPNNMLGYLINGEIQSDLSTIILDTDKITEIQAQTSINNAADETIFSTFDKVITIYEGNGKNANPFPIAHVFDHNLNLLETISFPNIEYRITDATSLDADNCFWVINYFYPGDENAYNPSVDSISIVYGEEATHSKYTTMERLLRLKYSESEITLVQEAPIQLELINDNNARNWEGIVRLDNIGFLLVTDKYPETILGFVRK